ncbi:MAG: sigma-70 family RNA polymerase sigma factor [Polyangiaceae bacterium]|nr:sigma-70 family RNA polymerase sigma factor [Polyangiaceae bacterium]
MSNGTTHHWVMVALERYEQPLLRYASAIVGQSLANDVVQDTFLRLCKQERSEVEPHLRAWLFKVCRNRAFDMRRDKRHTESVAEMDDVMQTDQSLPSDAFERKEAMQRVMGALDTLPEKQREAVLLKFSGDLSYQEIADVLGTSVSNVGVLLHTALKSLRQSIDKKDKSAGGNIR